MQKLSSIKHAIQRAPAKVADKASRAGDRAKALASSALAQIRHPFQRRHAVSNALPEVDWSIDSKETVNPLYVTEGIKTGNALFESRAKKAAGSTKTDAYKRSNLLKEIDTAFDNSDVSSLSEVSGSAENSHAKGAVPRQTLRSNVSTHGHKESVRDAQSDRLQTLLRVINEDVSKSCSEQHDTDVDLDELNSILDVDLSESSAPASGQRLTAAQRSAVIDELISLSSSN